MPMRPARRRFNSAFWLTAPPPLGAFCASLAATEGGGLRDGTWGGKVPPPPPLIRNHERKITMPILLWLVGIPIPLIILILLLR